MGGAGGSWGKCFEITAIGSGRVDHMCLGGGGMGWGMGGGGGVGGEKVGGGWGDGIIVWGSGRSLYASRNYQGSVGRMMEGEQGLPGPFFKQAVRAVEMAMRDGGPECLPCLVCCCVLYHHFSEKSSRHGKDIVKVSNRIKSYVLLFDIISWPQCWGCAIRCKRMCFCCAGLSS